MIDNIYLVSCFQINRLLLSLLGHIRLLLDDFGRCVLLIEILSDLMNKGLWLPSQGLLLGCNY